MRALSISAAIIGLACAATPATHGGTDTATKCTPTSTVVWLALNADSGAGSTYLTLQMTNLSRQTCALYGYPGVSAIDLAGRQVGAAAARDTAKTAREVRLATGGTASATLRVSNVSNFPAGACRPVQAAGFRVYLPNATQAKVVPFPLRACSRSGSAFLRVRVVDAT
jgi:hypothetical protein